MKIYKIFQDVNRDYDTYDAFVVYAENEERARLVHELTDNSWGHDGSWVRKVEDIKVEYLGEAKEGAQEGEILESFNAG